MPLGLDKEDEEENTLMPDERSELAEPVIVDTVTKIVRDAEGNPITAHINLWSNGVYTEGMQGNEGDPLSEIQTRLGAGDASTLDIQAKREIDF